jgi:hypothetical protein
LQNHPIQLAATSSSLAILLQESGIGEPTPYKSIDSQHSFMRKMGQMLPPVLVSVPSSAPCDPLEEPSPLGLTLKKTPSLLDLIAMQLADSRSASDASSCEVIDPGFCKSGKIDKCSAPAGSATQDKLKASNFPASSLKIGTWEVCWTSDHPTAIVSIVRIMHKESSILRTYVQLGSSIVFCLTVVICCWFVKSMAYDEHWIPKLEFWRDIGVIGIQCVSRYEGDLVTKCYYAKRKLVWEVLDSGLKSKVEIQWSDISAMKATCPESLPGSLEISV